MVEGLISFVFGAIKKRRATRKTTHYEHLSALGSPPSSTRRLPERFAGNAQTTQSCRFVVAPSLAQELGLIWRGDDDRPEGPPRAPLFPAPGAAEGPGVSRSRMFGSMRM